MKAKTFMKHLFVVIFALIFHLFANSQDTIIRYKKPIVPDYLNLQYAGNVGAYVIGAGYNMNRKKTLEFVVSYGFSLPHHSAKRIHNIAIKGIIIPKKWDYTMAGFCFLKQGLASVASSRKEPIHL